MNFSNQTPLAVLLPTYNAGCFLKESVESVLNQTFKDYHLYIYDDCSTDQTESIIKAYRDERIIYKKNNENLGLAVTLNIGLKELIKKYSFIARMDADDYCYPERFEKQIKFLQSQKETIMCGTQGYWLKDFSKKQDIVWTYPIREKAISLHLLFSSCFGHSSIMFNSKLLENSGLNYDKNFKTCEDWELWTRIIHNGKICNLSDFLMKYRIHEFSNHRHPANRVEHIKERCEIITRYWRSLGFIVDAETVNLFYFSGDALDKRQFVKVLIQFIEFFNTLEKKYVNTLPKEDQKYFRFRLVRNILSFWKRTGVSRKNLMIWKLILTKSEFAPKYFLVRFLLK